MPRLPAALLAFVDALDSNDEPFSIDLGPWRLVYEPRRDATPPKLVGLSGWMPVPTEPPDDAFSARVRSVANELEQAVKRMASERRPPTDAESLSRPMPTFEEDPLVPDDEKPAGPALTDRARAEFAAATAPKAD